MRKRGRRIAGAAGAATLAAAWLGPLPELAAGSFAAHMAMHVSVVAVAAPLLALGVAGGRLDPARRWPGAVAPIPLALAELAVVWGWHAPALHHAARQGGGPLALEQGSFLLCGVLVWVSAFGGEPARRAERASLGIVALLMTAMHVTLLGALLALAPRPLYAHGPGGPLGLSALDDQHLGGALMLAVGGSVYLAGALALAAGLVAARREAA
ncbi:MAG TPA: cytochrome c oxidase assembly protein [Thermoanaerobaculia bacterium]|nr:cytochrome c oxidase assembly protein [Thermoanaerobaculia bacterium]